MINPHERVAVALSGGKDSTVLLYVLDFLYAETLDLIGLHINLGIEPLDYSKKSLRLAEELCQKLDRELYCVDFKKEYQISMDMVKKKEKQLMRPLCAICGTFKRYLLNRYSLKLDCEKLATGHVLDDEVSVLFLNLFSGNIDQLIRTGPKLIAKEGVMITRVKPLYEVSELETTMYAQLAGLNFQDVDCPYSEGASSLKYKKFLQNFEEQYPGIENSFLQNFNGKILPPLKKYYQKPAERSIKTCIKCKGPTIEEICAFCNLRNLLLGKE